ncbi:MAG: InlB B-repeat-containing protein, partial [Clostridia bacterium]|nr:InlB B-repeat-containing protein [Clostridia bacterium]
MKAFNKPLTRTFLTFVLVALLAVSAIGAVVLSDSTQASADVGNVVASTDSTLNRDITKAVPMRAVVSSGGVTTPVVPEKTGYIFAGWYLDEELTIPYEGELITADLTLYAAFTPITYKVI